MKKGKSRRRYVYLVAAGDFTGDYGCSATQNLRDAYRDAAEYRREWDGEDCASVKIIRSDGVTVASWDRYLCANLRDSKWERID